MGFDASLLNRIRQNSPSVTAVSCYNSLTEEEIKELAEALEKNTHVRSLSLADCEITDTTLKPLAEVLLKHPSIESLNLTSNLFTDRGAQLVAEIIRQNKIIQKLELRLNPDITDEGASYLNDAVRDNYILKAFLFEKLSEEAKALIGRNIDQYRFFEKIKTLVEDLKNSGGIQPEKSNWLLENIKLSFDNFQKKDNNLASKELNGLPEFRKPTVF